MSRFIDASQLALTKLKTRRLRLTVTLVISSILFCLLLAAAFIVQGGVNSMEKFRSSGFGSRYIVSGYPVNDYFSLLSDPDLVAKANDLQKQVAAQKKAEAKRLGIEYSEANETPYVTDVQTGPSTSSKQINTQIPALSDLLKQKVETQPGSTADFKKTVSKYGAKNIYYSVNIAGGYSSGPPSFPYLKPLKDGKENFEQQPQQGFTPSFVGIDSLSSSWQLFSGSLIKPFMLPNQSQGIGADGSIPIIAPYTAVEQLLGLKPLSATASSADRLLRLQIIRNKAAGYNFDVCYRNSTSNDQIQQTLQQQQEIQAGKSQKDYKLPDLVYGLPSEACGPVVVTRDVRTAAQKKQDANELTFKQEFGQPEPVNKILRFRIVGLGADPAYSNSVSVAQIFQSILSSNLGGGWASPIELADSQPTVASIFGIKNADYGISPGRYAELSSASDVEKLLDEQNCSVNYVPVSGESPFKKCSDEGKYFSFAPFGSNSVALDHFKNGFDKFFLIAGLIISVVAIIVLLGTIGRIIADSRRETAVFRAIGAKRRDIAQIYLIYTVMVAILIALISTIFGYLISQYVNSRYSPSITVDALISFNVSDLSQKFLLSTLDIKDIAYVSLLILAAALLASVLPLVTNLRRNPIRDMRDER